MENRIYNLNPELLYAIEQRARRERSREMARVFALAVSKIAGLFRVTRHRDEALHA
ncbi:MAG TPA: hypothetical protein VF943_02095 [Burkholderiales bacterium]